MIMPAPDPSTPPIIAEQHGFQNDYAGYLPSQHPDGTENADLPCPFEHRREQGNDDAEAGDQYGNYVYRMVYRKSLVDDLLYLVLEFPGGQGKELPVLPEAVSLSRRGRSDLVLRGHPDREGIGKILLPVLPVGMHIHQHGARIRAVINIHDRHCEGNRPCRRRQRHRIPRL